MDTATTDEPATATSHVAASGLAPVGLTLVAFDLIWRASVGPTLGEIGWIVAGGTARSPSHGRGSR